jgi:DNA transposition AAA+ family ATPase
VLLAQKFGQRILWIEAAAAWGDKPNALLGSILAALGIKPSEWPISQFERLERVVERLKSSRLCVIIDEAHHMGPDCLNTVKTLINRTPGEFILAAMKTLWNRLERDSYQEVKQLTGNRLAERIKLSLRETDVKKLLDRRLAVLPAAESKKALTLLMAKAPHNGNLAFVREVCKRARIMAGADAVTFEIVTSAISAEEGKR